METSVVERQLKQKLEQVHTDFTLTELEDLLKKEGLDLDSKPIAVKIEESQSMEEPLSLNSRLINLGKSQTVTLLASKVIYNAYRENDLTTLIRVGIIPNYDDLLDCTVSLLEVFSLFVIGLKHSADITYINTPGMTMKEYKSLPGDAHDKCETLLKSLKLNTNYALYTLHYNLLSGSTIVLDTQRFKLDAESAIEILTKHLNTTSKDVDVKVILTKYHTLKETYEKLINVSKQHTVEKLNRVFNQSSQAVLLLSKMEEDYNKQLEQLSQVDNLLNKLDESQQIQLLSKLNTLYESQFILHHSTQNTTENSIVNVAIQTLSLYEKNFKFMSENLDKLKANLNKRVISDTTHDIHKNMEDIILKFTELLKIQKEYGDLKHIVGELIDGKDDE